MTAKSLKYNPSTPELLPLLLPSSSFLSSCSFPPPPPPPPPPSLLLPSSPLPLLPPPPPPRLLPSPPAQGSDSVSLDGCLLSEEAADASLLPSSSSPPSTLPREEGGEEETQQSKMAEVCERPSWGEKMSFEVGERDHYLNVCVYDRLREEKGDLLIGHVSSLALSLSHTHTHTLSVTLYTAYQTTQVDYKYTAQYVVMPSSVSVQLT